MSPRVYVRKFDHDEARRRLAAGETVGALAREFEVSAYAVRRLTEVGAARQARFQKGYRERHTAPCESCGKPCLAGTHFAKRQERAIARAMCHRCAMREKLERIRFGADGGVEMVRCIMLDCANGERWQPPGNFSRGTRHRDLREGGIHQQCRACQTRARRKLREGRKVPCVKCGEPRLCAADSSQRYEDTGLCAACFQAGRRKGVAAVTRGSAAPEGVS